MAEKIRDMKPTLDAAIRALANLAGDIFQLEMTDNELSSKKLKRDFMNFRRNEFTNLENLIYSVREQVKERPKRRGKFKNNFKN